MSSLKITLLAVLSIASPVFAKPFPEKVFSDASVAVSNLAVISTNNAEKAPEDAVTVVVKRFTFTGNTLLEDAELSAALTSFVNRPLTIENIYQAAVIIENKYKSAGKLSRVILPRQDVTTGILRMNILESIFAGVQFDAQTPEYIDKEYLRRMFEDNLNVGEPVDLNVLARAQLLADDLPGLSLSTRLRPGQAAAETEAFVQLKRKPRGTVSIGFDNHSSASTGARQQNLNASLNNILFVGDKITGSLGQTSGQYTAQADFSAPVGYDGWRIGTAISKSEYKVLNKQLGFFTAFGDTDTKQINAQYPIIRTKERNLVFKTEVSSALSTNYVFGYLTSKYRNHNVKFSLSGDFTDRYLGGGRNTAAVNLTLGNRVMEVGNDGSYSYDKLTFDATRTRLLYGGEVLKFSMNGQLARKALNSSEKFNVGGQGDVRAYPSGEFSGDQGFTTSIELQKQLQYGVNARIFVDGARLHSYNADDYTVGGYGVGFDWISAQGLHLKADLARRIGTNPNPTIYGTDQDGTLELNRLWLSLTYNF